MFVELLSAPLIIKDFINGNIDCNYEIYLREMLNASEWFLINYPGGFKAPLAEAHGECDAINEFYEIDFKLFGAQTAFKGRKELSEQISVLDNGVIVYSTSQKKGKQKVTNIYIAFRNKSIDDLLRIRNKKGILEFNENDIVAALKVLERKKNVLLFFPYKFSFKIEHSFEDAVDGIMNAINMDFRNAFEYREKYFKNETFDTFFVCIYKDYFLIFKVIDSKLKLCDKVNVELLPTFLKLDACCDFWL